ncbi:UNVERIFIED_ORG: short-subunit dehydrogenase [Rhizobium nepotum]|nr:short-subunit dehydrogenase [Rhizobium nepotum]
MSQVKSIKGLAVVTGASTGIGYELARCAAQDGYDLIIVADEAEIETAATQLRAAGTQIEAVQADLSTQAGVQKLLSCIAMKEQAVDLLFANAGQGLGKGFLDQKMDTIQQVIATNISGTVALVHAIGNGMRQRGSGRILFTGSIAGFMPGTFQAVYNATKALINSFSFAFREELDGTGVTVTCLMPGATETAFFERADMLDTPVGKQKKDDPGFVAQIGYDAMMNGEGDVVSGWKNKLISAAANVTASETLAKQHRKMAAPEGK